MIPVELQNDLSFFRDREYSLDTIEDNNKIYIVFKEYHLPQNLYNIQSTELLIFTSPFYPNAGFDMFWVDQNLRLANGALPKNAEVVENHLGKPWRRFSYHPYNNKPWNPSEDNIVTFIGYVEQRLQNGD